MRTFLPLLAVAVLALGGCTRSVTTQTYDPNRPNSGVVYSLPKTLLKVSVTYTIEKTSQMEDGILKRDPVETVIIRKPILIEPILTSDPQNCFVLSGEGLTRDAGLDSSFKFMVNDNLLLAGVTADATDKTPEILQGIVSSGLSVVKMAAMAGEGTKPPMDKVADRLKAIDGQIAALAMENDPNGNAPQKMAKLDALLKEQDAWLSVVARHREMNTVKTEERDVLFTGVLDLAACEWAEDRWIGQVKAPGAMLGKFSDSVVPAVVVEVFANGIQHNNVSRPFSAEDVGDQGVIYRVPIPLRTRVTVAPMKVAFFDDYIPFAQVGSFNKVEARYKALAKRKTAMTFSAATGGLKEYGVEATSSAEAAARAADASLGRVQATLGEIKKAQDSMEAAKKTPEQMKLSDFEMQKRLADAEMALIEAQQKLEKVKSSAGSK